MSETRQIPLTRGLFATVDAADFEWLSQYNWCALKVGRPNAEPKFYAARMTRNGEEQKKRMVLMHRQILGEPKGKVVDHKNLDTLFNSRSNLRPTTQSGNSLNQAGHSDRASKFKGVYWHRVNKKWVADFRGKYLGSFASEEMAAAAYDKAALEYSPHMALTNMDIGGAKCLAS